MGRNYKTRRFSEIQDEINGKPAEKIDLSEDGEGRHLALKVDGVWYAFVLSHLPPFKEVDV